ncbi:hypothetical protein MTO96_023401 [Rhipicephalus appendiculatus]
MNRILIYNDDEDFELSGDFLTNLLQEEDDDLPHLPPVTTQLVQIFSNKWVYPPAPPRFSNPPAFSAGTLKATPLQSDGGTELTKEASQSCSRQLSVSLPPTPTAAVTEKHTSRTDVTKVEELGMSTSSESVVSRSCSRRSAFPLCLPEFSTSSGHSDSGEAKAAEDFSVMRASEASEAEQEVNDEISIVTDASSDVLPEALPSRVESPEASCSRGSGQSILEEGDVVLTELTTWPFAQFTEPLEMPRGTRSESLLTAIEVGLDQEGVDVKALAGCDSNKKLDLPPEASGFDVGAADAVATNVDVLDHQAAEKSQEAKAHSSEHQSSGSFNLPQMSNLDYTQTDSEQGAEPNVEAGHEPQRSQEGTGMVVQATVRHVTAELDVEEGQVELFDNPPRCGRDFLLNFERETKVHLEGLHQNGFALCPLLSRHVYS